MGRLEDIAARNRPTGAARHSLPPEQMKWVFIGLAVVMVIIVIGGLVSTCNDKAARERGQPTEQPPAPAPVVTPTGRDGCRLMRRELEPIVQRLSLLVPADMGTYCADLEHVTKSVVQGATKWIFMGKYSTALSGLAKQCEAVGGEATHAGVRTQVEEMGNEVAAECSPP